MRKLKPNITYIVVHNVGIWTQAVWLFTCFSRSYHLAKTLTSFFWLPVWNNNLKVYLLRNLLLSIRVRERGGWKVCPGTEVQGLRFPSGREPWRLLRRRSPYRPGIAGEPCCGRVRPAFRFTPIWGRGGWGGGGARAALKNVEPGRVLGVAHGVWNLADIVARTSERIGAAHVPIL